MSIEDSIARAAELFIGARHPIALTGAGISTPSGIPDFRSPDTGLWSKADPMAVASIFTFRTQPEAFYEWIRPTAKLFLESKPNPAHLALAELEEMGLLKAVITQNIDNLHQQAGSRRVLELHGHFREAICLKCQQVVPTQNLMYEYILEGKVPRCDGCGGVLKPKAVFFGEPLPMDVLLDAQMEAQTCDLMLVAGSSLEIVPAADLPFVAHNLGAELVVVNHMRTPADARAEVVIREDVAEVLPAIVESCRKRGAR
jgi:NAD-dependent deacetylase